MVHLLKVALGEKKKSVARKRSNLVGEFPGQVMKKSSQPFLESVLCPLESCGG